MQFSTVFRYWIVIACSILAFSCGGGSGDGSSKISSSPAGTYQLIDFTITMANGTTITPSDVESFSGTMAVTSDNFVSQNVCVKAIGGSNECSQVSGWLEIGENTFIGQIGDCEYNASYSFDGTALILDFPMGICGANYSEVSVWHKTSDSTGAISNNIEHERTEIGAIIGSML